MDYSSCSTDAFSIGARKGAIRFGRRTLELPVSRICNWRSGIRRRETGSAVLQSGHGVHRLERSHLGVGKSQTMLFFMTFCAVLLLAFGLVRDRGDQRHSRVREWAERSGHRAGEHLALLKLDPAAQPRPWGVGMANHTRWIDRTPPARSGGGRHAGCFAPGITIATRSQSTRSRRPSLL